MDGGTPRRDAYVYVRAALRFARVRVRVYVRASRAASSDGFNFHFPYLRFLLPVAVLSRDGRTSADANA